ncbi:MAG: hypothetical protein KDE14_04030 [Rhodobacteraceae bacterium]|nr:hypothetical protein [Paracoccaceae bacterium]
MHAYAAIWALGVFFCHAALAQSGCAPYSQGVGVSFSILDPDPVYSNTLNVTSLRDFLRARGHVISGHHQRTLGVTSYQSRFVISGRTFSIPTAGGYCVYFRHIDVEYGYLDHDVFVASEYPPGSCEYNAILDHENQHVAINRVALREGARLLRQELEQALERFEPKFSKDPQTGTDRAIADLQLSATPTLNRIERDQAARNAVLDSTSNYEETGKLCENWDRGNVWPRGAP